MSDVLLGGPAESAGIEVGDVVASIDGKPVESVPMISLALGLAAANDTATVGLLHGSTALTIGISVAERPHPIDELTDRNTRLNRGDLAC